jgi:hypothetical protein
MKLVGQQVVFFLCEEGADFFHRIAGVKSISPVIAEVAETDDLGIWVRARQQEAPEWVLLLRWEFILGIEVREEKSMVGLRG